MELSSLKIIILLYFFQKKTLIFQERTFKARKTKIFCISPKEVLPTCQDDCCKIVK